MEIYTSAALINEENQTLSPFIIVGEDVLYITKSDKFMTPLGDERKDE